MYRWYVIQTKPRKENDVEKHLCQIDVEVLNPKVKSLASGLRPLFPNYIFVRWDLLDGDNYHLVRYTRGVNKVLGRAGYAVPVSDGVIGIIKERLNTKNVLEGETMKIGSRVKVRRGLLKDLVGVLEKPVSAEGRVAVLLKIHERYMKTTLSCKEVALVS